MHSESDDQTISVCTDMFTARGYTNLAYHTNCITATNTKNQTVELHVLSDPKLNIDTIKYYYSMLKERGIKHGVLIYRNAITSSVKKILELVHDVKIELFLYTRMQYNIMNHDLVPSHLRISKVAGVDYGAYPKINFDDPVVRFLDFSRGDLIKIIRKDGSIYYRIVK